MQTSDNRIDPARTQTTRATASGWIGSALEYYDFFIYAQAAAMVFPQLFFPAGNPKLAIVASLATYGVGYVARPIGGFVLGRRGDTHGRKHLLLLCMFLMGASTFAVGLLPTYHQVGMLAPILLVTLRLVQGFAVAGEISGASSMILEQAPFGRRGYYASFALQGTQAGQIFAAAIFMPLAWYMPNASFVSWGWRIPFLLSALVLAAGVVIRRNVSESPAFISEDTNGSVPASPITVAFRESWREIVRIAVMATAAVIAMVATIFGAAYAVQPSYGIGFHPDTYLAIPLIGNIVAVIVIPFVGKLSDRIGRRIPVVVGSLGAGLLSYVYLYAISARNAPLAIVTSVLMWGVVYQGFNAVFPSFMPELFPTRTRVSAMSIGQNIGMSLTALLPSLFAAIAPPGTKDIPFLIGSATLAITAVAAIAAWTARETHRIPLHELGMPGAAARASSRPANELGEPGQRPTPAAGPR
ncbi:MFS transporter [Paraburkholderia caballeronis]|uniref:Predicted arabinose efflux permease, MFS family n=1 Tax=Paraburkholderia caballeronis TaxID=416943 RepID=A0A1H7FPC0_9BURK|nr:MFS transporter [Paraburkholderia caballeronis]PXW24894.1 putative MFS family arabinose efflux permease [Paraburkholderia caballeronis]PXX00624.1 putative MFS family arabinose efflux permease [Paraburkholderia caballeronis]RAJ98687.1 putative MFS family arabinose efflux permease [Paraburkholderia caballeronis]SEE70109.1 Predicted arabinose efflux permease, MFS family [Paraburkholderia caballeronis]SEK27819.1 Predicted arabinose efflux permease, MFS family [Paraburkholderia caballeronis]